MRSLLLSIVISLLAVAAPAQKSIAFTWTPGNNPGWVSCSTGTYCLTGYTFYEMTSGIPVAVAAVPETNTSLSLSILPSIGIHVYHLVQNGLDGTGSSARENWRVNRVKVRQQWDAGCFCSQRTSRI